MEIECTTKTGTKVTLKGTPSSEVSISTLHGVFTGYWGRVIKAEGFVCKGVVNGKEVLLCAQIDKKDWDTFRAGVKAELLRNVPGLEILKAAINAEIQYHEDFEAMMDDEFNDGVNPPSKPQTNSAEIAKQYPIAAAYLKARAWECAAHFSKSAAGRKAKNAIAEGNDYNAAIALMEKEWSDYCANAID